VEFQKDFDQLLNLLFIICSKLIINTEDRNEVMESIQDFSFNVSEVLAKLKNEENVDLSNIFASFSTVVLRIKAKLTTS